jgi:hypothetical protein
VTVRPSAALRVAGDVALGVFGTLLDRTRGD